MCVLFSDVDECVENKRLCAVGKECVNTVGSFKCQCIEGYEMKEGGQCVGE